MLAYPDRGDQAIGVQRRRRGERAERAVRCRIRAACWWSDLTQRQPNALGVSCRKGVLAIASAYLVDEKYSKLFPIRVGYPNPSLFTLGCQRAA